MYSSRSMQIIIQSPNGSSGGKQITLCNFKTNRRWAETKAETFNVTSLAFCENYDLESPLRIEEENIRIYCFFSGDLHNQSTFFYVIFIKFVSFCEWHLSMTCSIYLALVVLFCSHDRTAIAHTKIHYEFLRLTRRRWQKTGNKHEIIREAANSPNRWSVFLLYTVRFECQCCDLIGSINFKRCAPASPFAGECKRKMT